MRKIAVGDLMTRNMLTAKPSDSLHTCAKKMAKERINSILITDSNRLLGILTARDILSTLAKKPKTDLKRVNAAKIAKRKLAVIKPSADIAQALSKMRSLNFRRLPVLSRGELIGIITLRDILAVEPDLYKEMHAIMDEVREREKKVAQADADWPFEGLCENCGAFSDLLKVEGQLLCPDCRDELH